MAVMYEGDVDESLVGFNGISLTRDLVSSTVRVDECRQKVVMREAKKWRQPSVSSEAYIVSTTVQRVNVECWHATRLTTIFVVAQRPGVVT